MMLGCVGIFFSCKVSEIVDHVLLGGRGRVSAACRYGIYNRFGNSQRSKVALREFSGINGGYEEPEILRNSHYARTERKVFLFGIKVKVCVERLCSVVLSLVQRPVRLEHLHVVRSLKRCRLGAVSLAHGADHLGDALVLMLVHPIDQLVQNLRDPPHAFLQ